MAISSNLMIAFHAEYDSGDIQYKWKKLRCSIFKFDQLPEIPFKGSIATCNDYANR